MSEVQREEVEPRWQNMMQHGMNDFWAGHGTMDQMWICMVCGTVVVNILDFLDRHERTCEENNVRHSKL